MLLPSASYGGVFSGGCHVCKGNWVHGWVERFFFFYCGAVLGGTCIIMSSPKPGGLARLEPC